MRTHIFTAAKFHCVDTMQFSRAGIVHRGVVHENVEYLILIVRCGIFVILIGLRSVNNKGEEIMYDLGSKIDATIFPGY